MSEPGEMRQALIDKFYELAEIHCENYESQEDLINAADTMGSIYRTLFLDEADEASPE